MEEQANDLYELMGKKKPVEAKNSNIAESNLFRNVSDAEYSTQNIPELEKRLTPEQQEQYQILNSYLSYIKDDKEGLNSLAKQMTGKNYDYIYPEAIISMFLSNPDMYSFEDDLAKANDLNAADVEKELTDAENNTNDPAFYAIGSIPDKRASDKSKNKLARQFEVDVAKKSGDPGDALNMQEHAAFDVAADDKMDWGTKGTVLAALRDASRY